MLFYYVTISVYVSNFSEEGNGNPLQCSCLENPRDGGAWWAAVCGVAQSRTLLKRLNSIMARFFIEDANVFKELEGGGW